ncbi:chorismate lyase [Massilia sp. W12]|uniref:chorismate--pyruvate lyase family protein n=1 Tax=Massilia sp. W12 TaxID=3126507 RepID=UPI0030D4248A
MKPARAHARAHWRAHVNAAPAMRIWLMDQASLTLKLRARCQVFRVRCLHQWRAPCLADEAGALGLPRRRHAWEREVLLECDGAPVVFAHTVTPLEANADDWPQFSTLGERSLGSILFGDPLVRQGALQLARLAPQHPLAQRALAALRLHAPHLAAQLAGAQLYARRCLYRRKHGVLLVTEVFFPWLLQLPQPRPTRPQGRMG